VVTDDVLYRFEPPALGPTAPSSSGAGDSGGESAGDGESGARGHALDGPTDADETGGKRAHEDGRSPAGGGTVDDDGADPEDTSDGVTDSIVENTPTDVEQ